MSLPRLSMHSTSYSRSALSRQGAGANGVAWLAEVRAGASGQGCSSDADLSGRKRASKSSRQAADGQHQLAAKRLGCEHELLNRPDELNGVLGPQFSCPDEG